MNDEILEIIKEAIEDLNEDLDYDSLEDVNKKTVIYDGSEASIDSLSLVALLTDIEKKLKKHFKKSVILADEKAMSMPKEERPYRNVEALLAYAVEKVSAE